MARRGSGDGSIYQRESDGRWVGAISIDRGRKVFYGDTRGEVAAKMKTLLASQQNGVALMRSERLTLGAFLDTWVAGMKANVRPSTWLRYEQLVRCHIVPRLGRITLTRLMPTDLTALYAAMLTDGLAPRTAGHVHRVLGRALRDAEVAGLLVRNPARFIRPPRVPHAEMQTLTSEQVRQMMVAAKGERLGALYIVAVASGARLGELLALRWRNVDPTRGTIRILATMTRTAEGMVVGETKTAASRRTVPMGRAATDALRAHRLAQAEERLRLGLGKASEADLVFTDAAGRPVDGTHASHMFALFLRRAGLPRIRFHDLRHTCATLLLEAGMHPRVVAERLGHSTPALVLNVYGHVTERMQEQATAALDSVLGA